MSKLIKRAGKKPFKFQVDVHLDKATVNIKFPCELFILWKRGPHKKESKNVPMDITAGTATFNEDLQIFATLFQDPKTKKYQEKKSTLTIVISTPKGNKIAGSCEIDLSSYPNQGIQEKKEVLGLKKSPDPNAKIHFTIKVNLISELDSNMSMMSAINEEDSDDEAGSSEASQFDHDTTRSQSGDYGQPKSRSDMDNILSNISTTNLQQEVMSRSPIDRLEQERAKQAQGLGNGSLKPQSPNAPDTLYAKKIPSANSGGDSAQLKVEVEEKKSPFSKLFNKEGNGSASESSQPNSANLKVASARVPSPLPGNRSVVRGEESNAGLIKSPTIYAGNGASQNEIDRLKSMLEQLRRENEELKQEKPSSDLPSDEIIQLRDKITNKNGEISALSKQNVDLQKEVEDLKQNIYRINKEKASENRNIMQEVDKAKDLSKQVEKEKEKMQQENQKLASKIEKLESEMKNLKSDYNTLEKENAANEELYTNLKSERDQIADSNQVVDMEVRKYKEKNANLDQEVKNLREQVKGLQNEKDQFQKTGLEFSNQAKEKIRSVEEESEGLRARLQESEKAYKEQISKADDSILDLKKQLKEAEGKREEALSKQTQLAIDLQRMKIDNERMSSDLQYTEENYLSKLKDTDSLKENSEKEIMRLREKLAALETQFKSETSEYQQKIEDLRDSGDKSQALYEEEKAEREQLQERLKAIEHDISMKTASQSNEIENIKGSLESQIQVLTQTLELKDAKLNNLTKENKGLMEEVKGLKRENAQLESQVSVAKIDDQSSVQINELQDKLRLSETNSRVEFQDLKDENERLKRELSLAQNSSKAQQDVENELGQLSMENDSLKKQVRDLNTKLANSAVTAESQNNKELEEFRKKIKELRGDLRKAEDDLTKTKSNYASLQIKNEEDDDKLSKQNKKVDKLQEAVGVMEMELVKAKQKMGEIMNVIMESADADLVDKVHAVVYESS